VDASCAKTSVFLIHEPRAAGERKRGHRWKRPEGGCGSALLAATAPGADPERYREIAEYCLRDVHATVDLYRVWKDRLAGVR